MKLPYTQVLANAAKRRARILKLSAEGMKPPEIARKMGVSPQRIRIILQPAKKAKA